MEKPQTYGLLSESLSQAFWTSLILSFSWLRPCVLSSGRSIFIALLMQELTTMSSSAFASGESHKESRPTW